ncbi:MAG: hypothetical protein WCT45_01670 [Candidatus Paceibacterota bacterium]|jgi:hypothetical protein
MQIKEGKKYKVIIKCHHFEDKDSNKEGIIFYPDEVYKVDFLFERNGTAFVFLGTFKNQYGEDFEKIIGLDLFKNCFEEISD